MLDISYIASKEIMEFEKELNDKRIPFHEHPQMILDRFGERALVWRDLYPYEEGERDIGLREGA